MYEIVTHDEARDQLDELPERLVGHYLEARTALETSPWTAGRSSKPANPDANVYTLDIGDQDEDVTVWYAIAERDREVHILEVLWL